ncbi:Dihydroorotate dehydrogenase (quinone), mitochondrial [Sphaceloma murrayae]|uniref:Dihydroorotate dehydrogenase (Quinone), mitochondrial n=1 Tax=Sphaceloma murrayae TaxID=2082308 RepID=A0A2K1QFE4_9PEZI|nr:Dihydroorotate dehydrogenase (quinone), mitochondrial [Sphaceloma murrayae]
MVESHLIAELPAPVPTSDRAPPPLALDTTPSTPVLERPYSPSTPSPMARPPTPGGGPLSSHPATPVPTNDRFAPSPPTETPEDRPEGPLYGRPEQSRVVQSQSNQEQEHDEPRKADSVTATTSLEHTTPTKNSKSIPVIEAASAIASAGNSRPPSSHLTAVPTNTTPIKTGVPARKPLAPASPNPSKPLNRRNSTGVRKLLSLTSLRSSFSSSRTSLPQPSPDPPSATPTRSSVKRPSSPSISSTLSPSNTGTYQTYTASVSGGTTPASSTPFSPESPTSSPRLRKRKSGSWFKRASMMMLGNDELENVPEGGEQYVFKSGSAGSSPRESEPRGARGIPTLPEIRALEGEKGWGEGMFASIGR